MIKIGIPLRYSRLEDGRCILYLEERVRRTFQKAGAFVIPIVQVQDVNYADSKYEKLAGLTDKEKENIEKYLDMVDGVVFPGGFKITKFDEYLLERCIERNIPTLGICLGMQLMSSYKEKFFNDKNESSINHKQENNNQLSHKVNINRNSRLYKILEKDEIMVNSFHGYHVSPNKYFSVSARSEDNYIEAIELNDKNFVMGVQWHPEISYDFDENSRKIIHYFINKCREK